jgi:threonine synthase
VYGAQLHKIPGARIEATRAVLKAVKSEAVYASHAYNPIYLLGQQSFAWEVWEQTDGRLPDAVIIPVGQGGLLMGAWLGFRRLILAGMIEKMPRLYAVQPEALAPIHNAFSKNLEDVAEVEPNGTSIAKGLSISKPVRGKRILQALRESGGGTATVTEDEIGRAYIVLARKGFFVEPTSAVAAAAIRKVRKQLGEGATILAVLTGSGLKSPVLDIQN